MEKDKGTETEHVVSKESMKELDLFSVGKRF